MNVRRNAWLMPLITILTLLIAGTGVWLVLGPSEKGAGLSREKPIVKVGCMKFPLPFFIAQEKRFFAQEGLDVEMVEFMATNVLVDALVKGDIDTAVIPYSSLFAVENAVPGSFMIYFSAEETESHPYSFLLAKPAIGSVRDLKGKRVVIRQGYPSEVQAKSILRGLGLDPDATELVQVARPLVIPTFGRPDVAACLELEPTMTEIVQQRLGKILIWAPRPRFIVDPFPSVAGVFNSSFVTENPNLAAKVKRAVDHAIDFMHVNEQESRTVFGKVLGIDQRIVAEMYLPRFEKLDSTSRDAIDRLLDFHVEHKIIDGRPNLDAAFYEN